MKAATREAKSRCRSFRSLERVAQKLTAEQREVFSGAGWNELREIAELQNCPLNTALCRMTAR